MAITGKFVADFASFYDAVKKAQVSLDGFEGDANKVGKSLNRMAESLSGRKLIQEATLMAEAVNRIGGPSKLTASELERVGAKALEATEKLRAMGEKAPERLQALADSARHAEGGLGSLGGRIAETAAGFLSAEVALRLFETAFHAVIDGFKQIGEIALTGAKVADVEDSFKHLTTEAGLFGQQLLGTLRTGTRNTISDFELMRKVNQGLAAGLHLTEEQFGIVSRGAFALAKATGGDLASAYDTVNDALVKGRPKALDALHLKLNLAEAEENFAKKLGTTAEHLNDTGKLEAARIGILDAVAAATKRVGEQTDGLGERVAQVTTYWANLKEELGKTIATSKVLEVGLDGVRKILVDTFGHGSQEIAIQAIAHAFDTATISIIDLGKVGVEVAGFLVKEFFGVRKLFGDLAQIIDGDILALKLLQQTAAIGLLPGNVDLVKWKQLDDQIKQLEIRMYQRGQSLKADEAAQAEVDVQTQKWKKSLTDLQVEMEAARKAGAGLAEPIESLAKGQEHAGRNTEQLTKQTDKEKAAIEELKKAYANLGGLSGTGTFFSGDVSLDAALKLGASVHDLALVFRLSEGEIEKHKQQLDVWSKVAIVEANRKLQDFEGELKKLGEAIPQTEFEKFVALRAKIFEIEHSLDSNKLSDNLTKIGGIFDPLTEAQERSRQAHIRWLEEFKKSQESLSHLQSSLAGLSGVFYQLAQLSGGSFSQFFRTIGVGVKAAESFVAALKEMNRVMKLLSSEGGGFSAANLASVAAGWIGVAVAIYEVVRAIQSAKEEQAKLDAAVAAAARTNRDLGGIYSDALTSAIQKTEELLEASTRFKVIQHDIFVVSSDQTAYLRFLEAIKVRAQEAAEALHLADLIREAGGAAALSAEQLGTVLSRVSTLLSLIESGDQQFAVQASQALVAAIDAMGGAAFLTRDQIERLFQELQRGGVIAAAASKVLDQLFGANVDDFLKAMADVGNVLTPNLKELIKQLLESGRLTDEMKKKLQGLVDTGLDFDKLESIAKKYGSTLSHLGGQLAQSGLDRQFQQIYSDLKTLEGAGGDTNLILEAMSGDISKLVQDAKKFGLTIPQQFKPYLESLLKAGLLTDADGNKLKDLSGINFADTPLVTALDKVAEQLQRLIDLLLGIVDRAKDAAGALAQIKPPPDVPVSRPPRPPETPQAPSEELIASLAVGRAPARILTFPTGAAVAGFGSGASTVIVQPGAVVLNKPSFRDRQDITQTANEIAEALSQKIRGQRTLSRR